MKKDESLAEIKQEGTTLESDEDFESALLGEQEENPEESQPEDTTTDTDPSQEGEENTSDEAPEVKEEKPEPFHKHPRWIEMQEKAKAADEVATELADLKQSLEAVQEFQQSQTSQTLPQWWVTLYGDDDLSKRAYGEYNSHEQETRKAIKEELLAEQEALHQQNEAEERKWDEWVNTEIEAMKAEGEAFEENALLKVARDFQPTDESGNISLRKSLQILKQIQPAKKATTEQKKRIAAKTSSNNHGGSTEEVKPSTNTVRHIGWSSVSQL